MDPLRAFRCSSLLRLSSYLATARSVDRLLDAASGVFGVLLYLPHPKLDILAGMTCAAKFAGVENSDGKNER